MTAHDAVVQPRFLLSSDLLVYSCSFVVQIPFLLTVQRPVLCQILIFGWPGLEGDSPKPRGFLRSAQSSPGHPTRNPCFDKAPGCVARSSLGSRSVKGTD